MSKKKKGGGYLSYFRSGIRFSERLFKNLMSQLKWIWDTWNSGSSKLNSWVTRNHYHISVEYGLEILIALVLILIALPSLTLWAILKSI